MKRCIATVLLMLSLEALVAGRLSAAVADDDVDTIRLPSHGLGEEVINGNGEERPWKCCDVAFCTRSFPRICLCLDRVKHCASTCKRCEKDEDDPSRHVCNDWYHGDLGPRCTEDGNGDGRDNDVPSGVARDHQVMAAAANLGKTKGGDGKRPWKCCDVTVCTRSIPPICRCLDKVKHCASTCKRCEKDEDDSSSYICKDSYRGDPGPRCTEDGNGDGRDNDVPSEVARDHQVMAAAANLGKTKGGDGKRPWKCCDVTVCTRSIPPICRCLDKVKHCTSTCKRCEKDEEDSSSYICKDSYRGDPGPRCTEDGNGDGSDNDVPNAVACDHRVMAATVNARKTKGGDKKRPWKCCDVTVCTRSFPPTCRCLDKVKHCTSTCKRCEDDEEDSSRHVCNDWYHGDPGPRCTKDVDAAIGTGGN